LTNDKDKQHDENEQQNDLRSKTSGFSPDGFTNTRFPNVSVNSGDHESNVSLELPEKEEDDQDNDTTSDGNTDDNASADSRRRIVVSVGSRVNPLRIR
jgi:hypothetical protein